MVFMNLVTGETRPARCGRLSCGYCAARNAWRRSLAISAATPERAITITLVADAGEEDPWTVARRRINRTREYLTRAGVLPGEWVSHVEPNPQDTGYHAHVWQHGSYIPKGELQEAAHRAGAGWTRVEKVRSEVGAGGYGLKGMGYGLKGVAQEESAREYLRVNGGRLTHQSRGFFRADGATLPVRVAEAVAVRQALGESEGTWTLATEAGARSYQLLVPGSSTVGRASVTRTPGKSTAGGSTAARSAASAS